MAAIIVVSWSEIFTFILRHNFLRSKIAERCLESVAFAEFERTEAGITHKFSPSSLALARVHLPGT